MKKTHKNEPKMQKRRLQDAEKHVQCWICIAGDYFSTFLLGFYAFADQTLMTEVNQGNDDARKQVYRTRQQLLRKVAHKLRGLKNGAMIK